MNSKKIKNVLDLDLASQEVASWVYREKIQMLFGNHSKSWLLSLVAACLMFSLSFSTDHWWIAMIWLLGFFIITLVRALTTRCFCRRPVEINEYNGWCRRFFVQSLLAGGLWGVGGFVVAYPLDIVAQLLVLVILLGVAAAAVPMLGMHQGVMLAFQLPAILPYMIWMSVQMEYRGFILMAIFFAFMAGVVIAMRRVESTFSSSLKLQFETEQLADSLNEANQQLQLANEKLEHLTLVDPLTHIHNRRYFDMQLDKEWKLAIRERTSLALLVLDIDYFKRFNDTYGHGTGDDCLYRVAQALVKAVQRPGDVLARIGGEEFVVLLPGANIDGARIVGEALRSNVEDAGIEHATSDVHHFVTLSIGISVMMPTEGEPVQGFFESADNALYQAKEAGRNRVMVSGDPGIQAAPFVAAAVEL